MSEEKTAYIKLIRGTTHMGPDGVKHTAKRPSGPFPLSHPSVAYARRHKRSFQIIEQISRRRGAPRAARGGRGAGRIPAAPVAAEQTIDFGAEVEDLMTLTRANLIKRNISHALAIKVTSGMTKKVLSQAIFGAEQDMLREPDESVDVDDDGADDSPEPAPAPARRRKRRGKSASAPDTDTAGE